MNARTNLRWVLALIMVVLITPLSHAAVISWGTASNVSSDSDVNLQGTLVEAANNGLYGSGFTSDAIVNGVTFQGWGPAGGSPVASPGGHFAYTAQSGYFLGSAAGFDAGTPPVSNLSGGYRNLLAGATFAQSSTDSNDFTGSLTLTVSGLTINSQYLVQWWINDSRPFTVGPVTATAGNSVSLDPNTNNSVGGTGQWVIGTFTADAVTQPIVFSTTGNADGQNAFQLRLIPEPGSTLLVAPLLIVWLAKRSRASS